jgi:hypothetical protein
MSSYQCPKCFNILPISNKILHDLKCTKERPVQFSQENPYTSSVSYNYDDGLRYSTNDYSNLRISTDLNLASELRNSAGSRYYKRMSYMNDDGTTTEIKKDTNMSGKEELLEITYDPQGNIIGRKKADGGRSSVRFKFHELQDYSSYDPMDNYNIYEGGSVYVQTVPTTEIIYEPVTSYTIDYSNANNLYEHDFGTTGYSLMHNNINNGRMVNLDNNNTNSNNTYSNSYTTNYQTNNTNSNLNQYFTDYNYNNTYTNQNSNVINNSNNYNYSTTNYDNYFQNTSTNTFNTGNNYNYQSNNDFQCAKVTKLN